MPSAIILAAGSSTRLGQPKQNIRIADETLLERATRIAGLAGLAPIFVIVSPVLAQNPDLHPSAPSAASTANAGPGNTNTQVLINHEAAEGIASSIRLGVRASLEAIATGAVVLACDQIAVTTEHLRSLTHSETEVRASSYAGHNGIPAYFPASSFAALLLLTGDTGARDLLRHAIALPLPDGDFDIDTPADLVRARRLYPDITSQ